MQRLSACGAAQSASGGACRHRCDHLPGRWAGGAAHWTRAAYPTDLTDAQWACVAPLLPPAKPGGRPRDVDLREVVNAALYRHRGRCSWRLLPHEFPPWQTVYTYVRHWQQDGTWARLLAALGEPLAPHTLAAPTTGRAGQ